MLSQFESLKPQKSWHKSRSIFKWLSITPNFAFTWKNKTELSKIDLRQRFKQPQETWASQTFARLIEDAQNVDSSKSTRHFPGTHGWREINQENGIFPVEFVLAEIVAFVRHRKQKPSLSHSGKCVQDSVSRVGKRFKNTFRKKSFSGAVFGQR